MFTRRHSLRLLAAVPFLPNAARAADAVMADLPPGAFSEFSKHLRPIGRVLEPARGTLYGHGNGARPARSGPLGRDHLP